mmetsp:Transcript_53732/g.80169  ORF Transcript_53732/g.80169 Transcript_53732/m.80169 type:complete len:430 (-) Transcript_53732:137-1426(-)
MVKGKTALVVFRLSSLRRCLEQGVNNTFRGALAARVVDRKTPLVVLAECSLGEGRNKRVNDTLGGTLQTSIVQGKATFIILGLTTLGVRHKQSVDNTLTGSIEAGTMQGQPSILITRFGSFNVGSNERFYHSRWRVQDTRLVKGEKSQVPVETLGDDPRSSFVRKGIRSSSRCLPILLEHQSEKDGTVFVVHLIAANVVVCGGITSRAGDAHVGASLGKFRLKSFHGHDDSFLVLTGRSFNELKWHASLAVLDSNTIRKRVEQSQDYTLTCTVTTGQVHRQHALIILHLSSIGIDANQGFNQSKRRSEDARGMNGEQSPTRFVRVCFLPTDPSFCFKWGGIHTGNRSIPILAFDTFVEFCSTPIVVHLRFVVTHIRMGANETRTLAIDSNGADRLRTVTTRCRTALSVREVTNTLCSVGGLSRHVAKDA